MNLHFVPRDQCALCGSKDREPFDALSWEGFEFSWVICTRCGLVYMHPVPDRDSYLQFYRGFFWDHKTGRLARLDPAATQAADKAAAGVERGRDSQHQRRPRIQRFLQAGLPRIDAATSILEIGCAWGETLDFLHATYGARVLGVEPSDYAVAHLRQRYPFIELVGRTAEELYGRSDLDGQVNAILFSHVLENITDQNETLAMARRVLAPGGVIYVDTCDLYWHRWPLNPYHPYVYTPDTIEQMLRKHGFEVVRIEKAPAPALAGVRRLREAVQMPGPYITLVARTVSGAAVQPTFGHVDADRIRKQLASARAIRSYRAKARRYMRVFRRGANRLGLLRRSNAR